MNVELRGGDGGSGAVSFLREKFRPRGGPDGGDGGDGGDVIIRVDAHLRTLRHLEGMHAVRAEAGLAGRGGNRTGRRGRDAYLNVPLGTVVYDSGDAGGRPLIEMVSRGEVVVAYGGAGGRGNRRFATAANQAPLYAEAGDFGERRGVEMEVRLIADVALVGAPNAGKSTLLAAISRARPKVASYPFTTVEPVLGVVKGRDTEMVVVEIPGLIEGAHRGRGLGRDFLRHCDHVGALAHLVDGMAPDLAAEHAAIDREIAAYGADLDAKPRVVAVTKLDIPEARSRFREQGTALAAACGSQPLGIAAATGEGVSRLVARMQGVSPPREGERELRRVPRLPRPDPEPRVSRGDVGFEVACRSAERILATVDLRNWRARLQVHAELGRLGVMDALSRAGASGGDTVRIGAHEFVWE